MQPTTLRALFDELIDLGPSERAAAIARSALSPDERRTLEAMLAFDTIVAAPADRRVAVLQSLDLEEAVLVRLHAMLESDDSVPQLLRDAAGEAIRLVDVASEGVDAIGSRLVGTSFGEFTLLDLIAEGGSSAVFRAQRTVGDGTQLVALKVLRTGLFSRDAQRRFRREQSILAQLEHPNIARLIE
ncbi:MAG: hypothetical protein ACTHK2_04355, partial [Dokdonella sp.]